ncbi:hypothetical protein B0I35DRAFT_190221 [Stachybotrys elegans]|uniref:Macro domain-containing protein n=1 Tax=Stachybotrys elegans TaxID=80388 RepID=A0A8K0SVZ3_9HYPO|nr:hypothetical protein B0I35DRAFT_190221 [Stachybotrys elegans]
MAASRLSISEIPTVAALYRTARLKPPKPDLARRPASASLNDRVHLIRRDITTLEVDAVVNAANRYLAGGGGVDGSIHRAAGPRLQAACDKLDGCPTGDAKMTPGFNLPARYVIHAVGPRYGSGDTGKEEALLRNCYTKSLTLAADHELTSVAFSCISTGIYGYPHEDAAHVAIGAVRKFMEERPEAVQHVVFVTFTTTDVATYNEILPLYFPATEAEQQ